MSVSLLLVPVVIAAVSGTVGAATVGGAVIGSTGRDASGGEVHTLHVETRMRDTGMLVAALRSLGAEVTTVEAHAVTAQIGELTLELSRPEGGVWSAHIDAAAREVSVDEANELMYEVDRAYSTQVQQAVIERIVAQAPGAGLHVAEQTVEADSSVRIVLDVLREGGTR